MLKLILMLVNIAIILKEAGACLPGPDNNNGPDRDCIGKPDFSPCNQPCRALWCTAPYTKCFANKCESHCYDQADGSRCGEGLGRCLNQSCETVFIVDDVVPNPGRIVDVVPNPDDPNPVVPNPVIDPRLDIELPFPVDPLPPGQDCSGKPDFSPCNQECKALSCRYPFTKCFDNKCRSYCFGEKDGSKCGKGRGECKNQSCEPGGWDCSDKPDFSPCTLRCKGTKCVPPYTKCFDNICRSYCSGKRDGSKCGKGKGECQNQSCQPGSTNGAKSAR